MNTKNNKIDINQMIEFVKKNARYFIAGALFVILLLILVHTVGNSTTPVDSTEVIETETQTTLAEEAFQENAFPAVNELIANYYSAYADGNMEVLTALASPVSSNEQGYISLFSQYVEGYENVTCYTKQGLDANSYLVSVYLEVKFVDIDTTAPGLDFFYVRTNEDGSLYIDNLYSQYNLANQENALDTSVQSLISEFENNDDVIALQQEVQAKYDAAIAADENLATVISTTIPTAISEWVTTIVSQNIEDSQATEVPETTEEPVTEQPEEEVPEEEAPQETVSETVMATATVNVRAAADTASDRLGSVNEGTTLTRTGTEGEWSIIDYNGSKGYIKSEFLTTDTSASTSSEGTADSNGIAEGTVITLENSTNIRSGMSETSDKVGVAYMGEKVTVVMSYAEGWTKVTWNNKTGYVKTELLQ